VRYHQPSIQTLVTKVGGPKLMLRKTVGHPPFRSHMPKGRKPLRLHSRVAGF
jgi:hypothetical protein